MQSIIPHHPRTALSAPASGSGKRRSRSHEDLARVAALDPEQLPLALAFLSGYHPKVFDAVLEAVEPCDGHQAEKATPEQEPFCLKCGAPVGIFLAHGQEYRHYRGILAPTSKPKPYKADHAPIVAWRRTATATAAWR